MEELDEKEGWQQEVQEEKTPEVVKNEPDDKPAAKTLNWTILIAVIILLIIYIVFFYLPSRA